jgi:prophage antirepressor-like protein
MSELRPTTLQPFMYHDTTEVRTIQDDDDQTWWALPDVCEALGLKNIPSVRGGIKDKHVQLVRLGNNNNRTTVISEPALYRLILRSNRPEAEPFQDWVFEEVLPTIRRTGQYLTDEARELHGYRATSFARKIQPLRTSHPTLYRELRDTVLYDHLERLSDAASVRRMHEIAPPNT